MFLHDAYCQIRNKEKKVTNDKNSNIQYDLCVLSTSASIDNAINIDTSVFHRLLFALGYGQLMGDTVWKHDGKSWETLIRKSFCITDLIRLLRRTRAGFIHVYATAAAAANREEEGVLVLISFVWFPLGNTSSQHTTYYTDSNIVMNGRYTVICVPSHPYQHDTII